MILLTKSRKKIYVRSSLPHAKMGNQSSNQSFQFEEENQVSANQMVNPKVIKSMTKQFFVKHLTHFSSMTVLVTSRQVDEGRVTLTD